MALLIYNQLGENVENDMLQMFFEVAPNLYLHSWQINPLCRRVSAHETSSCDKFSHTLLYCWLKETKWLLLASQLPNLQLSAEHPYFLMLLSRNRGPWRESHKAERLSQLWDGAVTHHRIAVPSHSCKELCPLNLPPSSQKLHSYKRKCRQYRKIINLLLPECVSTTNTEVFPTQPS